MSIDYSVYLKRAEDFSARSFEEYCGSLGLTVKLHPEFNMSEDSGFLPFRLIDERFAAEGENHDFKSGFEIYSSEYRHIIRPLEKKTGFFKKLFKAKTIEETPFDKAVKDASLLISLVCGYYDSFEVLLAYVFGAYLVAHCGGVFYDPQSDRLYDRREDLENEIAEIISELQEMKSQGELLTHKFDEWS